MFPHPHPSGKDFIVSSLSVSSEETSLSISSLKSIASLLNADANNILADILIIGLTVADPTQAPTQPAQLLLLVERFDVALVD